MTRPALAVSLLALAACAAPPTTTRDSRHDLEIDGEQVSLSFDQLPLDGFLKVAQQVTQQVYVYDRALVAETEPFSLVGQLQCERAEFGDFVRTMLYTRGLVLVAAGEGDNRCWEVRRASGS